MIIYDVADLRIRQVINHVLQTHHQELFDADLKIEALEARTSDGLGRPLMQRGHERTAITKILSDDDRAMGFADVRIIIDIEHWNTLTAKQQEAVIDHELTHILLRKDEDGNVLVDHQDRPKLEWRAHDLEIGWFHDVARRYKEDAEEYQQFSAVERSARQLSLPFAQAAV